MNTIPIDWLNEGQQMPLVPSGKVQLITSFSASNEKKPAHDVNAWQFPPSCLDVRHLSLTVKGGLLFSNSPNVICRLNRVLVQTVKCNRDTIAKSKLLPIKFIWKWKCLHYRYIFVIKLCECVTPLFSTFRETASNVPASNDEMKITVFPTVHERHLNSQRLCPPLKVSLFCLITSFCEFCRRSTFLTSS